MNIIRPIYIIISRYIISYSSTLGILLGINHNERYLQFQVVQHYTNRYLISLITESVFRITLRVLAKSYVIRERQKHRRSYAPHFIVIHQRCVFNLHVASCRDVAELFTSSAHVSIFTPCNLHSCMFLYDINAFPELDCPGGIEMLQSFSYRCLPLAVALNRVSIESFRPSYL